VLVLLFLLLPCHSPHDKCAIGSWKSKQPSIFESIWIGIPLFKENIKLKTIMGLEKTVQNKK
jgi:hypothetical protein